MRYEVVIGLEVHAQLATQTKLFCGCSTAYGAPANTQTCPICVGMPGVLPVLNRQALEMAIKVGLALHCTIAPRSRFARKNYFYPDLPKGYQISQYEEPLAQHGNLDLAVNGHAARVGITRVHLEEDAGKSLHEGLGAASHVDFNRAGVPLLEIVSEPDLRVPTDAVAYLRALREILMYLEVCDGNMEQGNLRCDANISLRPLGQAAFGTKVEVKNLNSFRFVQKALEHEMGRQERLLQAGGRIVQDTRLYDPQRQATVSMRSKEEAHDYRYFPEPDLVPCAGSADTVARASQALPELPRPRRERLITQYHLPDYDAGLLTASKPLADYFEEAVRLYPHPKPLSNWILTELLRRLNEAGHGVATCPVRPTQLAELLQMVESGEISRTLAKEIFTEMYRTGQPARQIVKTSGLTQVNHDEALLQYIDDVLAHYPAEVVSYREGKVKVFGYLVGQVMRASSGKANPTKVNTLLKQRLEAP